jgi:hypothetical protein
MQMTRFVERQFFTEQEEESDEWVKAYTEVPSHLECFVGCGCGRRMDSIRGSPSLSLMSPTLLTYIKKNRSRRR